MRIEVTLGDILHGQVARGQRCMVARAVQRQVPQFSAVTVGHEHLWGTFNGKVVQVALPEFVGRKIRRWDRTHCVLPFTFDLLDCPTELLSRLGPTTGPSLAQLIPARVPSL